eukprot:9625423-Heterocapsa_arctica.AAC.1
MEHVGREEEDAMRLCRFPDKPHEAQLAYKLLEHQLGGEAAGGDRDELPTCLLGLSPDLRALPLDLILAVWRLVRTV